MNALKLMRVGSYKLKKNNILSNILDSEILLSKSLNKSREEMLINLNITINKKNIKKFNQFLNRRLKKEPVAYILGEKEFWSKKFLINNGVLIPRPETELLVDRLSRIYKEKKISILDMGTGSGCIIISLISILTKSYGDGIDISNKAISLAKKNANKYKLSNRIKFFKKSFNDIFSKKYDLIVSNPPYVMSKDIKNLSDDIKRFEPILALDGGNDGLDLIKKIIYKSKNILKINGTLAIEIGKGQFKKVSKILFDNKYRIYEVIKDYKHNVRCILAKNIK